MRAPVQYAIPSYQRPVLVQEKTLAYLRSVGIDPGNISVFVATEEERNAYLAAAPEGDRVRYILGVPTLPAQRAFIAEYYPPGTLLVSMDDDVADLAMAVSEKRLEPVEDLARMVEEGFEAASSAGTKLWGVAPLANAFYLWTGEAQRKLHFGLKFCVGCCYGYVVELPDEALRTVLSAKEDYERCLRYWKKYGCVARFQNIAPRTKFYSTGGLEDQRSPASAQKEVDYLVKAFPGVVRLNPKRKGDYPEILLKEPRPAKAR